MINLVFSHINIYLILHKIKCLVVNLQEYYNHTL